ncbi:MAG TPA: 50S ribosomal protein L21 [Candidatus Dormibacteraeota bacterium]|nr:50S ribosomal protein L21 [Candidatus Dormibacteraeota bacterium]
MPKPDSLLSAIVVSGGKQYRVAPGDQILVDRLAAEPGSSIKLGRVLLLRDGTDIKVGTPGIDGLDVEVKVLAHRRGPRVESLRYKSKKRVRVHHGGRADLTAIQILSVGGLTEATGSETKTEAKPKPKASRGAAKPKAEAEAKVETKAEAPAKRAPRKTKTAKEPE